MLCIANQDHVTPPLPATDKTASGETLSLLTNGVFSPEGTMQRLFPRLRQS